MNHFVLNIVIFLPPKIKKLTNFLEKNFEFSWKYCGY